MKYKEEDAFKSVDDFKVGDTVNVYLESLPDPVKRTIEKIEGDLIFIESAFNHRYHFKQCRKLTKIKPRTWYIGKDAIKSVEQWGVGGTGSVREDGSVDSNDKSDYIKVQEVVDD